MVVGARKSGSTSQNTVKADIPGRLLIESTNILDSREGLANSFVR